MKILYDHQAFTMQYFGGVSKCFCELVSHLPKDVSTEIGIVESDNIHLLQSGICRNLRSVRLDWQKFDTKCHFKGNWHLYMAMNQMFPFLPTTENLNRKYSINKLRLGNFDLFHPTFFDDYFLPYLNGKPFVLTVHDMMPELFPEHFKKNDLQILRKKRLVEKAAAIIAVSKQTKQDLIDILGISSDRITVIYHGGPPRENITESPIINKPYFLYMGAREGYKNFDQLLIRFAEFSKKYKDVLLVCTGRRFSIKELCFIKENKVTDRVIHVSATDKEVKNLYANAIAFIYPSLYEGFGIPILEAFAYGCPVLLNNKSCFPEIAGDAGIFFCSDNNGMDLVENLELLINLSAEERKIFLMKGYKQLNKFSWKESSKRLVEVYQTVLR